jgi:hypothetical protein
VKRVTHPSQEGTSNSVMISLYKIITCRILRQN